MFEVLNILKPVKLTEGEKGQQVKNWDRRRERTSSKRSGFSNFRNSWKRYCRGGRLTNWRKRKPTTEQLFDRDENINPATQISTPKDASNSCGLRKTLKRRIYEDSPNYQRKVDLQNELMEIKIYKHRLEVLKLEKDIGLPTSKFTKVIFELQTTTTNKFFLLVSKIRE